MVAEQSAEALKYWPTDESIQCFDVWTDKNIRCFDVWTEESIQYFDVGTEESIQCIQCFDVGSTKQWPQNNNHILGVATQTVSEAAGSIDLSSSTSSHT